MNNLPKSYLNTFMPTNSLNILHESNCERFITNCS